MYPDSLMPLQGRTLIGPAAPERTLRSVALLTAVACLVLTMLAAHRVPTSTGTWYQASDGTHYRFSHLYAIVELCREGQPQEALGLADHYLARPGLPPVLQSQIRFLRAGALRLLGRESEARSEYAASARLVDGINTPQDQMELLAQGGEYAQAAALARDLMKESAGDPYALNNACWELTMYPSGDAAAAERAMSPIAASTQNAAWLDTHAWSLYLSGNTPAAVAEEQRAINNITPDELGHAAYYHACLVGMQGNRDEANVELRRIFQNDIFFTSAWTAADRFRPAVRPEE